MTTTNRKQALLHEMLIDEFDSIFEKRWTVTGANGEPSATSMMSATTFFRCRRFSHDGYRGN
jgi:hypothetical protein